MRVLTLGGGPAGLYASLLLKRIDPSHEIDLIERNPRDATYGWGVVFSDRTLTEFREADYPTYRRITDDFILWDAIDIHYRNRVIRAGGQGFSGIARKQLLLILQDRCRRLGVDMTFEREFEDWDRLGDYDLVLAADGANSFTRKRFEEAFRPSISQGRARFIWFGTTRPFDSFTFIFRENEHGLFQVHAYPFEGTTSTFIVECHEDVWRRAGLEEATTEETMAYCQDLFAPELGGHRLLSNKSEWISFPTIKTSSWRHGNVVLLGDAAHTAHFSIGSGTKLAMEDSIALAEAFERHPEDLDAALADYELERRPAVERFQLAAAQSQSYFEDLRRYLHMEPMQFAFHLLTRSGRIDYDQLRLRDATFSDEVDRWFEHDTARREVSRFAAPPPMFVPLELRGLRLENRGVLRPAPLYSAKEGEPTPEHREALQDAASREPGLVLTETLAVEAEGRITPGDLGLYLEGHADALGDLVAEIHATSTAKVGIRLGHAGRRGSTRRRDRGLDRPLGAAGWPLLSASPLAYTPVSPVPREMSRADMERVREAFATAARAAAEAGADMLGVHMGHGYLLASFLSPLTNAREDEYGGSLEGRARYPLEVVGAVRKAWRQDRPLWATVTVDDWRRGGLPPQEAIELCALLREHGCDLLEPVAGQTTPDSRPAYGRMFLAPYADRVRNEVRVPTMTSGGITTTGQVNTLVAGGRADLCVMDA